MPFSASCLTKRSVSRLGLLAPLVLAAALQPLPARASAKLPPGSAVIPNQSVLITPLAVPNAKIEPLNPGLKDFPHYVASGAVSSVISPDQKTLLVLTSGYNRLNNSAGKRVPQDSEQYVFVFDISGKVPVRKQVIRVPNTFCGIVFDPSGKEFYVSGGVDDNVHIFDLTSKGWTESARSPVALGHHGKGVGYKVKPQAAGIAITKNGKLLVVADYYNDSISLLSREGRNGWKKTAELDLRPGVINPKLSGVPGGEDPFWVVIKGNDTAYLSSIRDREIDVVRLSEHPRVETRIHLVGQPNKMVLNPAGTRLYVAEDETDSVGVIDTATNKLVETIFVGGPARYSLFSPNGPGHETPGEPETGNNTNSVAVSADGTTLYVTNGTANDVAVVSLALKKVVGLIPTGLYPDAISLSGDGSYMYVLNAKSPTGPNVKFCHGDGQTGKTYAECRASNEYDLQMLRSSLQSFPIPTAYQLRELTDRVAENNHYQRVVSPEAWKTMAFLHSHIKHIIYIIKENRTYDQILGDLPVGNGDPSITEFGKAITPNFHRLALQFVDLDNFYDRSEVSMGGWAWSTSARAPDVVEKTVPVNYAGRGLSYLTEGMNRGINVGLATLSERKAANPLTPDNPNVLPGTMDVAAPDGPNHKPGEGYLWDQALRKGLTVRNYGFFVDLSRYHLTGANAKYAIPEITDPYKTRTQVAFPTNAALAPYTDIYFRGFDNAFPDYYRYKEFARDFDARYEHGGFPNLILLRLMHDHTGNYRTAIDGINTPERQQADNDYAVGLVAQRIAHSRYADDTLIFVIEDDSQNGPDHVDTHRSTAYIIGPYVKHHAVISTQYNTLDFIRTMEVILGLKPLNISDALAVPMANVFDINEQPSWTYTATASRVLIGTGLPLPASMANLRPIASKHSSAYWAAVTKGMNFDEADDFSFANYNRILWRGLMGNQPYPHPTGVNLSRNRAELLERQ